VTDQLPSFAFRLTSDAIDTASLTRELHDSAAGACVTFEGRVRDVNEGHAVRRLEYESYEAVALKEGKRVMDEAASKEHVIAAQCIHRVGRLEIGEIAVWVGVISGHREEAFRACRYIIDEVKARVPIWKKEQYRDGASEWIENAP